ncbi:PAS and ANTAR domain-containing protein [Gordonia liuliyuniae]|uniref:PAS and ANTAR domain-containing protein n=1 Tax=Gordonia liuliyuniae TaxID=2911517 RepID=A0ABS9IQM6_9ACTN|nr:PAS and ANTAR domain-containing protein [Gordonia liuliyuniae]MCF8587853.1 PAS and ANTAR domain-containing protein [Gordonia liuliyuniae]
MTNSTNAGADSASQRASGTRVGSFRYWFDEDRWEWSDEVAAIHGYRPGEVQPTTALLISHKHIDDRQSFTELVRTMRERRTHFSSRHRIVDTAGRVHHVVVMGRTFRGRDGEVAGTGGFYVDLGPAVDDTVRDRVDEQVQHFRARGAVIEQAKGMLMLVYGIDDDRAFDVLRWLSQSRNVPVVDVCRTIVEGALADPCIPESVRREFDLVVLSGSAESEP